MDGGPSLSNMAAGPAPEADPGGDPGAGPGGAGPARGANFWEALVHWAGGLEAYLGALRAYSAEAAPHGPRAIGGRWGAATARLEDAAGLLATAGLLAQRAAPAGLPALMDAADAASEAARALEAAAGTVLDPGVRAAALVSMSRTYSEHLGGLERRAREAGLAAEARHLEAGRAAGAAGALAGARLTVGEISAAYAAGRGGLATELFVGALLCGGDRAGAARLLGAAADAALGAAPDSPAAAAADTAALAEYHPLQAMTYTPAAFGPPRDLREAGGAVTDLGLPQARLAVVYDLGPLVDRKRALAHGPLATTTAGLSYRLVERLKTIRAEAYGQRAPAPAAPEPAAPRAAAAPLLVTTDGKTARAAAPRGPGGPWAPLAGSHPRVEARSRAEAAGILAAVREDRADGWGLELPRRYEEAVRAERVAPGECGADALLGALAAEFEKAYDAAPPETPKDFHDLVAPEAFALGGYHYRAAARLGAAALEEKRRRLQVGVRAGAVKRVPLAVAALELGVAQAIQTADAGRKLWKLFRAAYRPDPEPFTLSAGQKRAGLLRAFQRTARAVAQAGPVYCSPPTLKAYALLPPPPG
jgi:hypothetical protein